jgi:hypothetical protein
MNGSGSVQRSGVAIAMAAGLLLLTATASHAAAPAHRPARTATHAAIRHTSITINGALTGPAFQGVGAISGGGGDSRLLIDYLLKHSAQAQQILDYLFKPGYGASLQILKLEIGGDAYATDGSEPSVEHASGKINCAAGYEFWLAKQARALNPAIQLYGLQWNAPSWVGNGGQNAWTSNDIRYIVDWLGCAAKNHLRINYIGAWNEHLPQGITPHVITWFEHLRSALNAHGYRRVKIVGVDSFAHENGSDVSNYLTAHPAFRAAIGVLGYHNLCRYPVIGNVCLIPAAARRSGKPIWVSEFGALRQGSGAVGATARTLNDAYIKVGATGLMSWPLINSIPADLPLEGRGLVTADQPWSGHYQVNEMTWILAQTTAFTRPGWVHVRGASQEFSGGYGSYVSYEPRNRSAWTMVAQTSTAPRAQTITVHLAGGLPTRTVHVWSTSIGASVRIKWFAQHADVKPHAGTFSYTLSPGFIYTFTTVSNPVRTRAVPAPSAPMPLPYASSPDMSNEPAYLAPQDGAFEYQPSSTTTFEQTAVGRPVFWQNTSATRFPYAVLGDSTLRDYTVSASVTLTDPSFSAGLIARFSHPKTDGGGLGFNGYQFIVRADGTCSLFRDTVGPTATSLGTCLPSTVAPSFDLSLSVHGSTIIGSVNGTQVVSVTDGALTTGIAGISTGGWYPVQFSGLQVTS